ncbi:MAG: 1-deoxy-D-xylulose-5-phosphate reductoisomerase, partial [Candidatus Methylomirabilia bacterium]
TQIQVVVHPQSIVHSMVEYIDGSVLAQLGVADMGIPILYALTYPDRRPCPAPPLDLAHVGQLTFHEPDPERFPCLTLAREALARAGAAPVVLNAANEVAVEAFLTGQIPFPRIPELIAEAFEHLSPGELDSIEECLALDRECRSFVRGALLGQQIAAPAGPAP